MSVPLEKLNSLSIPLVIVALIVASGIIGVLWQRVLRVVTTPSFPAKQGFPIALPGVLGTADALLFVKRRFAWR
jgi:hypothetical protein